VRPWLRQWQFVEALQGEQLQLLLPFESLPPAAAAAAAAAAASAIAF